MAKKKVVQKKVKPKFVNLLKKQVPGTTVKLSGNHSYIRNLSQKVP